MPAQNLATKFPQHRAGAVAVGAATAATHVISLYYSGLFPTTDDIAGSIEAYFETELEAFPGIGDILFLTVDDVDAGPVLKFTATVRAEADSLYWYFNFAFSVEIGSGDGVFSVILTQHGLF